MKRNTFITLLAVAIILGGAIGGALAGGIAIGKSQGSRAGQYSSLPSGQGNITGWGNFQLPGNDTTIPSGSRATMGTVEKVEGNVVTLKTQEGSVLVNIDSSTSIQKMVEGSLGDISPGANIAVSGDKNADGSIKAKSITLTSGFTVLGGG
jgi:hypothetical protein